MKYTIHGFSQEQAVRLDLDSNDLLVLRWLVDFAGTSKMRTVIEDGRFYFWINYKSVLQDLPILKISKQTLYKKHFSNLCESGVLEHRHIKDGGSFSYYTYGRNYDRLVYSEQPSIKNTEVASEFTQGCVETYQPPTSEFNNPLRQNLTNKDPSISNPSIIDESTSNEVYINLQSRKPIDSVDTCVDIVHTEKENNNELISLMRTSTSRYEPDFSESSNPIKITQKKKADMIKMLGAVDNTYTSARKEIVDYLNQKAGTAYRYNSAHMEKHANARLKEGYTVDDFKKVIDKKVADWLKDSEYAKYLRPDTLFGTKFENYLNQPSGIVERRYERGDDSL